MTIIDFTPWSALLGGASIGAGALLLLLGAGKIAGISGIIAGLGNKANSNQADSNQVEQGWRLAFVLGLMVVPSVLFASQLVAVPVLAEVSVLKLAVAGLLVGMGTRLGNGCTSGHGICGIGRF